MYYKSDPNASLIQLDDQRISPDLAAELSKIRLVFTDFDGVVEPTDPFRQKVSSEVIGSFIGVPSKLIDCSFLVGISKQDGNDIILNRYGPFKKAKYLIDQHGFNPSVQIIDCFDKEQPGSFVQDKLNRLSLETKEFYDRLSLDEQHALNDHVEQLAQNFRDTRAKIEDGARAKGQLGAYHGVNRFHYALSQKTGLPVAPLAIVTQKKRAEAVAIQRFNQESLANLSREDLQKPFALAAVDALIHGYDTVSQTRFFPSDEYITEDQRKPNPDAYLVPLEVINRECRARDSSHVDIKPEEVLVPEDSSTGFAAANDANMKIMWVNNGVSRITEEQQAAALFSVMLKPEEIDPKFEAILKAAPPAAQSSIREYGSWEYQANEILIPGLGLQV